MIKFKKQNIDDRDEAIKTLKILPEETESVICDICSAALKSEAWLEHHKKSIPSDSNNNDLLSHAMKLSEINGEIDMNF